jgi:FAD/FMN-containing dehydrogenase
LGRITLDRFSGKLLQPGDPGYDEARRLWNAMIEKRPAAIARCRSAKDVVAALARARTDGLEVAVRGGATASRACRAPMGV